MTPCFKARVCIRILALPMLLAAVGTAQTTAPPAPPAPDSDYTINVKVNEVLLHATVRNRKGTPVAGLQRQNFQIFEDRVMQSIKHFSHRDIPVTVGMVIDNSGSMRTKRAEVVASALAFAASSNPHDQMFLVNFNEKVWFGLPPSLPFTDHPEQLRTAMNTVIANGKTALYDAVITGVEHVRKGNLDKKVLIVVSDGADNASTNTREQMLAIAARSEVIIYVLGIYEPDDPENRHPRGALTELARTSGGEAYFPDQLSDVKRLCERIAGEIRNQYTLSYVPTNQQQDGGYRRIQVRAENPEGKGLEVSTRIGYIAPVKNGPVAAKPPTP